MSVQEIEEYFPRIAVQDYRITSPDLAHYNCIAWASGDTSHWWEPVSVKGYFWPDGVPRNGRLESWIRVFIVQGFELVDNGQLEDGFEKVAIYADEDREGKHVARQLPSGKWTSKLGKLEDIEHLNLACLEGPLYGSVAVYLKRQTISK